MGEETSFIEEKPSRPSHSQVLKVDISRGSQLDGVPLLIGHGGDLGLGTQLSGRGLACDHVYTSVPFLAKTHRLSNYEKNTRQIITKSFLQNT